MLNPRLVKIPFGSSASMDSSWQGMDEDEADEEVDSDISSEAHGLEPITPGGTHDSVSVAFTRCT
eukprot:1633918-Amphidinium_carterae.1